MQRRRPKGFSVPETTIVGSILTAIAVALLPFLARVNSVDEAHGVGHNLEKLRVEIQRYRADHGGVAPPSLTHLTLASDASGRVMPKDGQPVEFPFGPYLVSLPNNPSSTAPSGRRARVRLTTSDPPTATDLTAGNVGGWLYNPTTGGVWVDHDQHFHR